MNTTSEGKIKAQVKAIFKKYNVFYFMPLTKGYSINGITDYIGCIAGRYVGVECKGKDENEPTVLQLRHFENVRKAGGLVFLVKPSTIGEFENHIRKLVG